MQFEFVDEINPQIGKVLDEGFEKYAEQIAVSGCADRIKVFNRYIDDEEVPLFFSAADICVLPYKSATQSGITAI